MDHAVTIHIKGLVQGVGFRPFIFLLARKTGVKGWVKNTNEGVEIFAQAGKNEIAEFISRIKNEAPPASGIEELTSREAIPAGFEFFTIEASEDMSAEVTGISPDIAVCHECMSDMDSQVHRLLYPFINCTNCGPRFSIIRDMPYDRRKTSMSIFQMCDQCREEYDNINDRRFHAQPIACSRCGPRYELMINGDKSNGGAVEILSKMCDLLMDGKIIAVKGLGGYHLICDAFNEGSVRMLRRRKHRDGKPFAVMFRDIESLSEFAKIGYHEKTSLLSWQRPIVILDLEKKSLQHSWLISINSGLGSIGAVLPYMPIHHLLFRYFPGPAIVFTSGNQSAEPIVKDDSEALSRFDKVADAFLAYNREIVHRSDDSVVRVIGNRMRVIRRSRGFVPAAMPLTVDADHIVAFGAELTSAFCVGRGKRAFLGQYIGDLKTMPTCEFYEEALEDFIHLFRVRPGLLVCDLHPAYFSTKFAEGFIGLPLMRVQHHHAHIASCMGEHHLDEKVIGVAFDGTGYGSDGKIWGGEFLVCDLADYKRVLHFDYLPLPGGDKAIEQPWRTALAYLYKVFGPNCQDLPLPFIKSLNKEKVVTVVNMIKHGINCPEVSSAGRLFDAVAAILNLCTESTFQAEAPMRLESQATSDVSGSYSFNIGTTICVDEMIREITRDIMKTEDLRVIATKFHNTIISIIFESVIKISKKEKINKVVLSGGVFQNKFVLEKVEDLIRKNGLFVYSNEHIPTNDGGIAFGQLVIAAKRRSMKCV